MFAKLSNRKGVTMIEYALLAGLIAVALVVAIGRLNTGVGNTFDAVVDELPGQ